MTLSTLVVLHDWTDPVALHSWFNANVMNVTDPIVEQSETHIGNRLGQGFPAIFDVDWNVDRSPIVWFDRELEGESTYYREDPEALEATVEMYAKYPHGVIKIDFDTAYGYTGPNDIGCGDLHAMFIARLASDYLSPRGITFAWQNEFSGAWYEGIEGLDTLGRGGAAATAWYRSVVLPAIFGQAVRDA